MVITIDELLKGKSTIIKNKEYLSTEAYVTPFLEKMSKFTKDFRIQARLPEQISITKNDRVKEEDTVYNRVWIQAVLPQNNNCFHNHVETIGLVYGLDVRKPVAKIYRGNLNMACLNLCVFDYSFLNTQFIDPESPLKFNCIDNLMNQTSNITSWLEKLSNMEVKYDDDLINSTLGSWVRNTIKCSYSKEYGKIKLSSDTAVDAYKSIYEKEDSPYFVKKGEITNMFNIYNAWTDLICNEDQRDILNKTEKILMLKQILNLL